MQFPYFSGSMKPLSICSFPSLARLRDEAVGDEATSLRGIHPVLFGGIKTHVVQEIGVGQFAMVKEIHTFAWRDTAQRCPNLKHGYQKILKRSLTVHDDSGHKKLFQVPCTSCIMSVPCETISPWICAKQNPHFNSDWLWLILTVTRCNKHRNQQVSHVCHGHRMTSRLPLQLRKLCDLCPRSLRRWHCCRACWSTRDRLHRSSCRKCVCSRS